MATKSDKLYSQSPSVKKDANGKPGISKPTPAAADSMGLAGNPLPTDGTGDMPIHIKQIADMHERHVTELKDMHKRHQKEHETLAGDHAQLAGTDAASQSLEGSV